MARLAIRPVTVSPSPGVWSHALILSDSHTFDTSVAPSWIIVLTITGDDAETRGLAMSEAIDTAYHQTELKTPEELYQAVKRQTIDDSVSLAAVCFTDSTATLIGKGRFEAHLWRNNQHGIIISGRDEEWRVIAGPSLPSDRWWIVAGDAGTVIADVMDLFSKPENEVEAIGEAIQICLADTLINSLASVLVTTLPDLPEEVVETTQATAVEPEVIPAPVMEQPDGKTIKRRRVMVVGWVVLAILIVSVWVGARTRTEHKLSTGFADLADTVNNTIVAANALKPVDQVKAREELRRALETVTQVKSTYEPHKAWFAKWTDLNTKISTAYREMAGETSLSDVPEWFSLAVVKPGITGDQLIVSGPNLLVLDKTANSLIRIGIDSKRAEVVAGGNALQGAVGFDGTESRAVVLTNAGAVDVSLTRKTTAALIQPDDSWGEPTGIALFNGNVYLLDEKSGDIWRYPALTQGVAAKQRWLGSGVTLAGSSYTGIAVDGDVWLLQSSGTILRYRRGAPLTFTVSGLDMPLSSTTTALAVSPSEDVIAVLDKGNQRVVRLNKDGVYQKTGQMVGLS